jgi:Fe-S cluster assembly iron-binding protein IscA
MKFNEQAVKTLKMYMEEKEADVITMAVVQSGCSPSVQVDVKKAEESDRVIDIDGLRVAVDEASEALLEDVVFAGDDTGNIEIQNFETSCGGCGGGCGC